MQNEGPAVLKVDQHEGAGKCCRLCQAPLRHTFVDLGMSPLCESFVPGDQVDQMEPYYPLHVFVCENCFLVQLKEYVTPENIFSEYAYFSSFSTSYVEHAKTYCHMIKKRLGLGSDSQVYELASNDGYLLQHFLALDVPVTGIEPAANIAKVAVGKGIPTLVEFFGTDLAHRLAADGRYADLIVGNNVLAQIPDINDFTAGMALLLKPEGVITIEVPHLTHLIEDNQFDTIYHEHFSYFSLITLEHLAHRHGLRIFDIDEISTHGGSIRIYMCRQDASYATASSVDKVRSDELATGLDSINAYLNYSPKVHKTKRSLLSFLIDCKQRGKRVCGYGAPGKGNTLLNYCGIGVDFLDFTVDRNPYKHGRFTPGMHIPILPVSAIAEARPDYILILPWNLRDEIATQLRYTSEWGCKLIVPIPEAYVIDPREA